MVPSNLGLVLRNVTSLVGPHVIPNTLPPHPFTSELKPVTSFNRQKGRVEFAFLDLLIP